MNKLLLTLVLSATALAASAQPVEGEVRKIDKAQGKITLKHGEIKSLDMPPMTMVFRVSEARMLDTVAVGDKVRFDAEKMYCALAATASR